MSGPGARRAVNKSGHYIDLTLRRKVEIAAVSPDLNRSEGFDLTVRQTRRRVLISVRNALEARIALDCGVDFLDIKEPLRGPLGCSDRQVWQDVADLISSSDVAKRPVLTVAMGDLLSLDYTSLVSGVNLFKMGLAECQFHPHWKQLWLQQTTRLISATQAKPVVVAYADSSLAQSPSIETVLDFAIKQGVSHFLIDTFTKDGRNLFDFVTLDELTHWCSVAYQHQITVALAGSLRRDHLPFFDQLEGDLIIGMRSGVCEDAQRDGLLSRDRVCDLINWAHRRSAVLNSSA